MEKFYRDKQFTRTSSELLLLVVKIAVFNTFLVNKTVVKRHPLQGKQVNRVLSRTPQSLVRHGKLEVGQSDRRTTSRSKDFAFSTNCSVIASSLCAVCTMSKIKLGNRLFYIEKNKKIIPES